MRREKETNGPPEMILWESRGPFFLAKSMDSSLFANRLCDLDHVLLLVFFIFIVAFIFFRFFRLKLPKTML